MNSKELQLTIISAEKVIYKGNTASVKLPGTAGGFSILADHAPLISSLKRGTVSYEVHGTLHEIEIEGGFVEVKQGLVTVCIE